MKICAITMVYRDYWALAQWYGHFAGLLGPGNLFVITHGADARIAAICPGASVIAVPRDDLQGFDRMRGRLLNGIQSGLAAVYDWVIRTDADEVICLDPARHSSLADCLAAQTAPAVFALGLNLGEIAGDPGLEDGDSVFARRRTAVFSGHYSKAWAVRGDVALMRHGVQVRPRAVPGFAFCLPAGVYLVHLKFANRAALQAVNRHRQSIAAGDGRGLPGKAWQNPGRDARKFYATLAGLPPKPWEDARDEAFAAIAAAPLRELASGIVRAANIRFDSRTSLPDWFAAGAGSGNAPRPRLSRRAARRAGSADRPEVPR